MLEIGIEPEIFETLKEDKERNRLILQGRSRSKKNLVRTPIDFLKGKEKKIYMGESAVKKLVTYDKFLKEDGNNKKRILQECLDAFNDKPSPIKELSEFWGVDKRIIYDYRYRYQITEQRKVNDGKIIEVKKIAEVKKPIEAGKPIEIIKPAEVENKISETTEITKEIEKLRKENLDLVSKLNNWESTMTLKLKDETNDKIKIGVLETALKNKEEKIEELKRTLKKENQETMKTIEELNAKLTEKKSIETSDEENMYIEIVLTKKNFEKRIAGINHMLQENKRYKITIEELKEST